MRAAAFAKRNLKELLRDPLTLFFGLGFPLVLLVLMNVIQRNVPVQIFALETLAPGIALFGLTFLALFSGLLLARDRTSAFLARLTASPMTAADFLLGYLLPLLPLAVGQSAICLGAAAVLGLPLSWNLLAVVLSLIPSALLFTALGLLCGTLFNDKQVRYVRGDSDQRHGVAGGDLVRPVPGGRGLPPDRLRAPLRPRGGGGQGRPGRGLGRPAGASAVGVRLGGGVDGPGGVAVPLENGGTSGGKHPVFPTSGGFFWKSFAGWALQSLSPCDTISHHPKRHRRAAKARKGEEQWAFSAALRGQTHSTPSLWRGRNPRRACRPPRRWPAP